MNTTSCDDHSLEALTFGRVALKNHNILRFCFQIIAAVLVAVQPSIPQPSIHPLIPKPASIRWNEGTFSLSAGTDIVYTDSAFQSDAAAFNDLLNQLTGLRLKSVFGAVPPVRNAIVLTTAGPGSDSLGRHAARPPEAGV